MAINRNTTLPSIPGTGARNTASVMEGINNALMMYLKLKDQEKQDAIKNRELTRQEASQSSLDNYYKALAADKTSDNEQKAKDEAFKQFNTTATNYAGARVPNTSDIVGQAKKAGVDPNLAFTKDITLPATRSQGAMGLPAGGQSSVNEQAGQAPQMGPSYFTPPQQVPQEDTGNLIVNPPESEKMKIATLNEGGRNTRANTAEAGRNARAELTINEKMKALDQSKWFRTAELQLRHAGVAQAADRLKLAIATFNMNATKEEFDEQDKAFDNATKGGTDIAAIMKMITNDPSLPNPVSTGQPGPAPAVTPPNPTPNTLPRFGAPAGTPPPAGRTPAANRFKIVQRPQ